MVITFAAVPPIAIVFMPVVPVPILMAPAFVPVNRLNVWVPPEALPVKILTA